MLARTEDVATYNVSSTIDEDAIIAQALAILESRIKRTGIAFTSPQTVKNFCAVKLSGLEHEVFGVLFLNAQNELIEFQEMFRGTLTQTSVYPREVVKESLKLNAAAVIFTHNHPSSHLTPSVADKMLTNTLKTALAIVDVKVLDHIVVGGGSSSSMAELGLV